MNENFGGAPADPVAVAADISVRRASRHRDMQSDTRPTRARLDLHSVAHPMVHHQTVTACRRDLRWPTARGRITHSRAGVHHFAYPARQHSPHVVVAIAGVGDGVRADLVNGQHEAAGDLVGAPVSPGRGAGTTPRPCTHSGVCSSFAVCNVLAAADQIHPHDLACAANRRPGTSFRLHSFGPSGAQPVAAVAAVCPNVTRSQTHMGSCLLVHGPRMFYTRLPSLECAARRPMSVARPCDLGSGSRCGSCRAVRRAVLVSPIVLAAAVAVDLAELGGGVAAARGSARRRVPPGRCVYRPRGTSAAAAPAPITPSPRDRYPAACSASCSTPWCSSPLWWGCCSPFTGPSSAGGARRTSPRHTAA